MKKFIVIVVLFCLSTLLFKTEAAEIKDNDFEKFFTEFQNSLKKNKGQYWGYSKYIDDIYVFTDALGRFISKIQADYDLICKLSSKNKYSQTTKVKYKNNSYSDLTWSIEYLDGDYRLVFYDYYIENEEVEDESNLWCTFKKVEGQWKIVEFDAAG